MRRMSVAVATTAALIGTLASAKSTGAEDVEAVLLGPRPLYLVDDMDASELQATLRRCAAGPFERTDFSIGHRGAPLQFPEHTEESYRAAALMGAGIAVRPAHDDQHPRGPETRGQMPPTVHARGSGARHPGVGDVLHERHHARRVQDARG